MSCAELTSNLSHILAGMPQRNISHEHHLYEAMKHSLHDIGLPIICAFGIVGNALNLLVLTRKQLQSSMDRMEKSAHMGLVALAVSDILFCMTAFPQAFVKSADFITEDKSISALYYKAYKDIPINIFILSSTWLTVVMATGRYMAICHPLHARGFVDLPGTRIAIISVFVLSILFNLPRFWFSKIVAKKCATHCMCYSNAVGDLFRNTSATLAFNTTWAIVGVFIPLIILAVCNLCLIRALQRSNRMRRMYRAKQTVDSSHRLTPTLISIVTLFFILVSPSEILKFWKQVTVTHGTSQNLYHYLIAMVVTNTMQAFNFAVNFILYCVINVHFRKAMKSIVCCQTEKRDLFRNSNQHTITLNMSELDTENAV